jgi:hypothetical protein
LENKGVARMIDKKKILTTYGQDGQEGVFSAPKYVGAWIIGGMHSFSVIEKPTDEQIENTEKLLGWKWKGYE